MNKTYQFTIKNQPHTLTILPPPQKRGGCLRCKLEKEIWTTIESPLWIGTTQTFKEEQFCWGCSLGNLYKLEESDGQFENKTQIIKEIRNILWTDETVKEDKEFLECYA